MSFSLTSRNISLSGSVLHAECRVPHSDKFHKSSIDLNNVIGNDDGRFVHPGSGWFDSAADSHLQNNRLLAADLLKSDHITAVFSTVNLDEFITNNGGKLQAV